MSPILRRMALLGAQAAFWALAAFVAYSMVAGCGAPCAYYGY